MKDTMKKVELTEREIAVLEQMCKGFENKEISKILWISAHTVKAHISSIMRKLNVKNRTEAVYIAVKNKIVN